MADQPTQTPTPEAQPLEPILYGRLEVKYFVAPDGEPIITTTVHGPTDDSEDVPTYFDAVTMHAMAGKSIDQIYRGEQQDG